MILGYSSFSVQDKGCNPPLELLHRGISNEGPQHLFKWTINIKYLRIIINPGPFIHEKLLLICLGYWMEIFPFQNNPKKLPTS